MRRTEPATTLCATDTDQSTALCIQNNTHHHDERQGVLSEWPANMNPACGLWLLTHDKGQRVSVHPDHL